MISQRRLFGQLFQCGKLIFRREETIAPSSSALSTSPLCLASAWKRHSKASRFARAALGKAFFVQRKSARRDCPVAELRQRVRQTNTARLTILDDGLDDSILIIRQGFGIFTGWALEIL